MFTPSIRSSVEAWKDYIDSCPHNSHQTPTMTLAFMLENGFQTDSKVTTLMLTLVLMLGVNRPLNKKLASALWKFCCSCINARLFQVMNGGVHMQIR